jgi:hypothetical protein
MSKKEVAVKESTAMTLSDFKPDNSAVLSSMIKLPRLSIQQKMSKAVEGDNAKVGDLYENLGNTVICGKDQPFDFIPILVKNVVTTYRQENGRSVFAAQKDMNASNQKVNWEAGERPEIVCYLLSAKDLENDGMILPYVFTFRGDSVRTGGKALYTYSLLLQAARQPIFSHVFTMTNKKLEKDGNSYQAAYIDKPTKKVDLKKYGATIAGWVETLSGMTTVEVAPESDEVTAPTVSESDVQF